MLLQVVIDAMAQKARELGVRGVAGVYQFILHHLYQVEAPIYVKVIGRFQRDANKVVEGDTGVNYMGMATMKFAQMLSTLQNSGPIEGRPLKRGEIDYKGGLVHIFDEKTPNPLVLMVFFSGGSEDQDVEIAKAGISAAINYTPPEMDLTEVHKIGDMIANAKRG
jgi:hypothetical protein